MSLSNSQTVQQLVLPPTVSHDPNSAIAKMARDAKKLQVQSQTDSRYDTVLARDGTRVPYDTNTLAETFSGSISPTATVDELSDSTFILFLMAGALSIGIIYGISKRLRK